MEKILLTGATGYIGSHVAVQLIEAGREIVIADNLVNSSVDTLDAIRKITGVRPEFYEVDLCDPIATRRIFEENKITAVMHFAGLKAVGESVAKPVLYYRNNLDTTLTLLELMSEFGVNRFVFSSSATVYGEKNSAPLTEEMEVGGCSNPYGFTKYFIEQILTDAAKARPELGVALLRYFNPIGAHESGLIGERPNGIPNNLMPYITQTAAGIREKLSVFGDDYPTHDGTGVRDYIHVVDLASGHLKALEYLEGKKAGGAPASAAAVASSTAPAPTGGAPGPFSGVEIFNLGTGAGYSVLDVIKAFEKANGIKINYVIAPRRPGDLAAVYADPSKAGRLLGWHTTHSLEDMCRDAWNFEKNNH